MNNWIVFCGSFLAIEMLVLLQFPAASRIRMKTAKQLLTRFDEGMPLVWHWGILSDFILSGFIAWWVAELAAYWFTPAGQEGAWAIALMWALGLTVLFNWLWSLDKTASAHFIRGNMTLAGFIHAAYMVPSIWAVVMVYFKTPDHLIPPQLIVASSWYLGVHVFVGILHPSLNLWKFFTGNPRWWPLRMIWNPLGWATVLGCWAALYWRTTKILEAHTN